MADDDLVAYDTALNTDYMMPVSSLAVVGSSAVLLTGIMFPALRKREIYFQLILLMSFCDFLFSLTGSWGSPTTMAMCTIQAGFKTYFSTSSWMFVMMLTITIFCHFHFRRRYLKLAHMVIISFGVALLATCLPLTDQYITYSSRVILDQEGGVSCIMYYNYAVVNDDDYDTRVEKYMVFLLWQMVINFILPLVIIAIMFSLCAFLYLITLPRISEEDPEMALRMKRLVNYIVLYPIALTLCFGPIAGYGIYIYVNTPLRRSKNVLKISIALEASIYCYGLLASLIFFLNASSAREMWRRWFVRNIGKRWCNMEEEDNLLKGLTPEELDHNVGISHPAKRGKREEEIEIEEEIERGLSLIFSEHLSVVSGRSSYTSRESVMSAQSTARSSQSSNKSAENRLSSVGGPTLGGLATIRRASTIQEENPADGRESTRYGSEWATEEDRDRPLGARGSIAYDRGSDVGADSRYRVSSISLGARLSSFRDTIPEAEAGTTSVTMNPIVSTLEEEEEGDEGFSL